MEALPHDVLRVSPGQPLLRDGEAHGRGVAPVRPCRARVVAGTGGVRLRAPTHRVRLHFARPTKTASEAYIERQGVCRDYAHLAITLLRCLNIPARYCTGYLGDIGVPRHRCPHGFFRMARGLHRRCLAHLRSAQQSTPHRPDTDRPGARCRGCGHQHRVRAEYAAGIPRVDRRGLARAAGIQDINLPDGLEQRIPAESAKFLPPLLAHP